MGELQKITPSLCRTCIYRFKFGNFGHNGRNACNYLDVAGESRIFVKGEKVVPDGFCDKYVRGEQSVTSAKKWCDGQFYGEIKIKREGVRQWQT